MKILLLANSDWFLHRFCAELAATLWTHGVDVVLASPPGEFVRRLETAGHRWRPVRIARRRLRPWAEARALIELRALVREEKPDLIHFFTLKTVLYGHLAVRLAMAPEKRPAIVHSITGLGYLWSSDGPKVRFLRWAASALGRCLLPRAEVIFLNPDDREEFRRRRLVGPESGHLIPGSGVDCRRFQPTAESTDGPPVIAFVGRLLWSKGVGDFVAAARRLRGRDDVAVARFVLVGESDAGNPDAVDPGTLDEWRRQGDVEIWGFQDDMVRVFRRVAVVCLPTTYREGVPTVLLEAAACARPVIATHMPGCRDAVADGESGLLVPPRDVEALAEAMAALIRDPGRRRRMGERGRARVRELFEVRRVVEATLDVYRLAGLEIE